MANEHVSRRAFLGTVAGASITYSLDHTLLAQDAKGGFSDCASAIKALDDLPALKKKRITFDQAKSGNDAKKIAYLDQLLVEEYKLIADPKRNPDGFVAAWHYWDDKNQKKKASDAVRADMRSVGAENQTESTLAGIDNQLPHYRLFPRTKEGMGNRQKLNYLIVGKQLLGSANSEDELFSYVDEAYAELAAREYNMPIHGKELERTNASVAIYLPSFVSLYAARTRLELVLKGKRKNMSQFTEDDVLRNYAKYYFEFIERQKDCEHSTHIDVGGRTVEEPHFKRAYDAMQALRTESDESLDKLGASWKDGRLIRK